MGKKAEQFSEFIEKMQMRLMVIIAYCTDGVWRDSRNLWWVKIVKIGNLTVRGFLDGDLQNKACAMTYRTILAIVPFLAMVLAIGRGFGLGNDLQNELYQMFPSQYQALTTAFKFVDKYLAQSSEGIFVGIGIIFLLWTLVSLLNNVEDIFNKIWSIKSTRSLWRKLSDYTAILLILPILMICSSGLSIFMSTTLHNIFTFEFMSPVISFLLDSVSVVLSWLAFAGAYALIPNTRIKFQNALACGVLAGTGFQILQWLFVSGQMYVAKYNAVYGSFSFLPLLLIWLQLVWLITFIGARICFSSQNIMRFSFDSEVNHISPQYRTKVTMGVLTVIVQRFSNGQPPLTPPQIMTQYGLPAKLVDDIIAQLIEADLICRVARNKEADINILPVSLSHPLTTYSIGHVLKVLSDMGEADFIPNFENLFDNVVTQIDKVDDCLTASDTLLSDIKISTIGVPPAK